MHQHPNSCLNVIKDLWPYFYNFLKKQAELSPASIPFELAECASECIDAAASKYPVDFWSPIFETRWSSRDYDDYNLERFIDSHNQTVDFDINYLFLRGNETWTNKYNMTYDVKTGISVESEAYGVDFTTKKRLCDY